MYYRSTKLLLCLVTFFLIVPAISSAAPQRLCLKNDSFVVKRRCKASKNEVQVAPANLIGLVGAQGIQGIQGPQGEPGEAGPQGPKGDKGAKGDDGAQGPAGAAGIVDLASCYEKASTVSAAGNLSVEVNCNAPQSEFLLNHSIVSLALRRVTDINLQTDGAGDVPTGVRVTTSSSFPDISLPLTVAAYCCDR